MNFQADHQHQGDVEDAQQRQAGAEQRAIQQRRRHQGHRRRHQIGHQQPAVRVAHHHRQGDQAHMHQHHKHQAGQVAGHIGPHHDGRPHGHVDTVRPGDAAHPQGLIRRLRSTAKLQVDTGVHRNRHQLQPSPQHRLPDRHPQRQQRRHHQRQRWRQIAVMQMVIDVEAELVPSHTGLLGVFHSSPEGARTTAGESCIQKSTHDASASTLSSLHRQSHGQVYVEPPSHSPRHRPPATPKPAVLSWPTSEFLF